MQDRVTSISGLVAQYNPLSVKPGALSRANDCYIRRENIAEDRRGHKLYGMLSTQAAQLMSYSNTIIAHRGAKLAYDNGSGTFTDYAGTYSALSGQKMRFIEQFSNLYVTTSAGVKVFSDVAGTAGRLAGVPRCLDPSYVLNAASTGFLAGGSQAAYRCCIVKTDIQTNVIRGYPSTRLWVINPTYSYTAGTATNGSPTLSSMSSTVGLITGMTATGVGIPAGTTINTIVGSTVTLSANAALSVTPTGNITTGSNQVANISSMSGVSVGMTIAGTGIPSSTTITGISGTTVTMSNNATATTATLALTISISGTNLALTFSSPRNVDLTLYLPNEVVSGDVIEFYRTAQLAGTSSDISADEMALVYQVALTSTDISNGFITFTDSITDSLRGAALYTSPSEEGIQQANDRPPLAKDIASYKNFNLFANTSTKQRLFITMVGVGSLTGSTITLGGVTYNFGSTEIISGGGSPQVQVGSTGVTAVDIDTTARSLVRVINRYALNTTVYAYYLTGPGDLPGQIMVEEKGIGAAAFTVQSSSTGIAGMFFPAPPVSPLTNAKSTSSNQIQKNAVYYAKTQQGEHVPTLNYLLVGPSNKNILRIAPLRDSVIVIKEEGVYRIAGQDPTSFTVVPIDLTVFCKSADSVAILGNQVYMLSNQGIVAISDTAVQVVSRDIEQLIQPLLTFSNIGSLTSGFAYESERSYFISTMSNSNDTAETQTYVYNYFTKSWVRHSYAASAAVIGADDKMYFAKPNDLSVYQERKTFTDSDYADPEYSITINSIVGAVVTFTLGASAPKIGWAVTQSSVSIAIQSFVTNATPGSYTATLVANPPGSWSTGAATIFPSVAMDIAWHSWTGGAPDKMKQVYGVGILADDEVAYNSVSQLNVSFTSNFDATTETIALTSPGIGWGSAWGASPWGGQADTAGYPTWVPRNKQYCNRLSIGVQHPVALERLSVAGLAFAFEGGADGMGR
jgi:hypothetical protein